jgi:hypothetical protein
MITVVADGRVICQVGPTVPARAYWMRYARENADRSVQVWETGTRGKWARVSVRLN